MTVSTVYVNNSLYNYYIISIFLFHLVTTIILDIYVSYINFRFFANLTMVKYVAYLHLK